MTPETAVLRFGLGARPGELANAAPDPRRWLLEQVHSAAPLSSSVSLQGSAVIFAGLMTAREDKRTAAQSAAGAVDAQKKSANAVREAYLPHYRQQILARTQSAATTGRPFAERLVHFWANHFALSADKGVVLGLVGTLENEVIRERLAGNFSQLLVAVEQHPAMLAFLDNQYSIGPDSDFARIAALRGARRAEAPKREIGINENLAREIMELHTLGVNGGYTQADVTSFAQVLTGWSIGGGQGRLAGGTPGEFVFREHLHEPGVRVVLGKRYAQAGVQQGEAVLEDLARHPATAHFIAGKLARHFIADEPSPTAQNHIARAFMDSGGDLPSVYRALIEAADTAPFRPKYKTPEDFVFSSLRALEIEPQDPQEVVRTFEILGQRQYTPGSPAGWPDTAASWDGSDALMHRVLWASRAAARYEHGTAPDALALQCLGDRLRPATLTAVKRAASAPQALALLLMSPEFQRR